MTVEIEIPESLACIGDPLLTEAYREAAARNVLAALNPGIFFGYFSVCADGNGHGGNTTYPGLDWGQSAEALLWLGRTAEVLSSWDYVKSFQREDGLLPFAILPDLAGKTALVNDQYPLTAEAHGGVYTHWVPGNPLYTLANATALQLADAIFANTGDCLWLEAQIPFLHSAAEWLISQVTPDGMVPGGGFYLERPTRLDYDGVSQCCVANSLETAAGLFRAAGRTDIVDRATGASRRIASSFRAHFWVEDHCVEYIHPTHGPISSHGMTDVDWAAIATGILDERERDVLWGRLREAEGFLYGGMPTGIATLPQTYENWEMQGIDGHDLAAMGRVWYLECWARRRMGDRDGIIDSIRRVAEMGQRNGWYWRERYYSEQTGNLGVYDYNAYCEYPANLIRVVNRFL